MAKQLATVLIPVYKPQPDAVERLCLQQCIKVLGHYPVVFVCPIGFDGTAYAAECAGIIPFNMAQFPSQYFRNISGYNQLMLSAAFYKYFIDSSYILIHQLDAYIFRDELAYWCSQNYDYVGAPHLPHTNDPGDIRFLKGYSNVVTCVNHLFKTNHKISNVGNGGFSLRKTIACYRLLRLLNKKVGAWGVNNEDGFFKYWGNICYPFFRLPADEIALHFAIEENPSASLKKLGGKLPFGCHAFQKYEPETWDLYIHFSSLLNKPIDGH